MAARSVVTNAAIKPAPAIQYGGTIKGVRSCDVIPANDVILAALTAFKSDCTPVSRLRLPVRPDGKLLRSTIITCWLSFITPQIRTVSDQVRDIRNHRAEILFPPLRQRAG